jgi:hypothetical protein
MIECTSEVVGIVLGWGLTTVVVVGSKVGRGFILHVPFPNGNGAPYKKNLLQPFRNAFMVQWFIVHLLSQLCKVAGSILAIANFFLYIK